MALIQQPRQPLELPEVVQARKDEAAGNVSKMDAFATGIRRQNWASQAVYDFASGEEDPDNFGTDLDYDPFMDEANLNYLPERMAEAGTKEEAAHIRSSIDSEYRDLAVIESSGWGTAGEVFGGVFRPEVLAGGLAKTLPTAIAAEMPLTT